MQKGEAGEVVLSCEFPRAGIAVSELEEALCAAFLLRVARLVLQRAIGMLGPAPGADEVPEKGPAPGVVEQATQSSEGEAQPAGAPGAESDRSEADRADAPELPVTSGAADDQQSQP